MSEGFQLLLVRHGARDGDHLSQHGRHQVATLAYALKRRQVSPSRFLCSAAPAAAETCERLADALSVDAANTRTVEALTPGELRSGVDCLVDEGAFADLESDVAGPVILVGHEGRLSNLLTELTGKRARPFEHGGAVCLGATSLPEAVRGNCRILFRFPNVDHQEDALRPKAQSKMAVSTFFAGFVFTALIEILLANPTSAWNRAAIVLLSFSLALFVVTVYIYDELGMPEGFWTDGRRSRLARRVSDFQEHRRERRWQRIEETHGATRADEDAADMTNDGPLFLTMVATSRYVFTPAVAIALLGFVAIVLSTSATWVKGTAIAAVAVGAVVYRLRRASLGPD